MDVRGYYSEAAIENYQGTVAKASDAWLGAMEKSGLIQALKNIEVFFSPDQSIMVESVQIEPGNPEPHHEMNSEILQSLTNDTDSLSSPSKNMSISGRFLPLQQMSVMYGKNGVPLLEGAFRDVQSMGDQAVDTKDLYWKELLFRTVREWKLVNISLLKSDAGMELWVRDSRALAGFDDRGIATLKSLRDLLDSLGVSLAKVGMNGQSIEHLSQASKVKGGLHGR